MTPLPLLLWDEGLGHFTHFSTIPFQPLEHNCTPLHHIERCQQQNAPSCHHSSYFQTMCFVFCTFQNTSFVPNQWFYPCGTLFAPIIERWHDPLNNRSNGQSWAVGQMQLLFSKLKLKYYFCFSIWFHLQCWLLIPGNLCLSFATPKPD